jgi:hypothetical protein
VVRLALVTIALVAAGCGGGGAKSTTRPPPATVDDPGYPPGPWGYANGDVIADLGFVAKRAAPGQTLASQPSQVIRLGDFRSARLLVIEVAAVWCPDCNGDQPAMMQLEADYAPRGVTGIEILVDGAYQVAATVADIDAWGQRHHVNGTVAIDDQWAFATAADVTAIPLYIVVDTSDMRIADRTADTLSGRPLGPVLDALLAR